MADGEWRMALPEVASALFFAFWRLTAGGWQLQTWDGSLGLFKANGFDIDQHPPPVCRVKRKPR
jgi:hypothetical protein